jgi:hypothetical protein
MFEPELFGLDASQYRAFAAVLFTPTIGFVFIFLLGRTLQKLPLLDVADHYKPPRWVLPIFALGGLLSITIAMSAAISLSMLHSSPSYAQFLSSYQKEFSFNPISPTDQITKAIFTLEDYDGDSDFYIFVNNYRLFSSEVNCLMNYQCRKHSLQADLLFNVINNITFNDNSLHNIHDEYTLPHSESFLEYLVAGDNFVDIISGNSGHGDCVLKLSLTIGNNSVDKKESVEITPDIGQIQALLPTQHAHVFHSYGESFDISKNTRVAPYQTEAADPSYRLCERIRFKIHLDPTNISPEVADLSRWTLWAAKHLQHSYCEITNQKGGSCNVKTQ